MVVLSSDIVQIVVIFPFCPSGSHEWLTNMYGVLVSPPSGLSNSATGRWLLTVTWRIAMVLFPELSVAMIVTFFSPGVNHAGVGFWSVEPV